MSAAPISVPDGCDDPAALLQLDTQGYLLLRHAVPADWIVRLRAAFDVGVLASDQWPVPRQMDWCHAQVDLDPYVQRVCRLPALIDAVRHRLKAPFFLSQVEGRAPRQGNMPQPLHRDGVGHDGQLMAAMVWLDRYGPDNGATQLVPGSHRLDASETVAPQILTGEAGDVLIFDPDLLHGATSNASGASRRSLLLSYAVAALQAQHRESEAIRGVRMDTREIFGGDDRLPG